MKTDKIILTDCDGVLLNWEYAFDCWMEGHGHKIVDNSAYNISQKYGVENSKSFVRTFNESAAIGFLPAHRDATHYVRKIHEELGYKFRVITSLSLDPYAKKLRQRNLIKLFGSAIETVICLDTGADKDEALAPYTGTGMYWIEDKLENAIAGSKIGLNAILMEHEHNMHYVDNLVTLASDWEEIYNKLVLDNQ
jgi:FMN phosphatase YigB (HAD superfamily)